MNLKLPVTAIKGIGEKRAKQLHKLGLETIDDLLHYYPRNYEQFVGIVPINELQVDHVYFIKGIVKTTPENRRVRQLVITSMTIEDDSGRLKVLWFNQPYMKKQFKLGQEVILKGKYVIKNGVKQLSSPKIVKEAELIDIGSLAPLYPLTKGISNKLMTQTIKVIISYCKDQLYEFLPMSIRGRYQLCEYNFAIQQIHEPEGYEALVEARKRLIFNEFLFFQLGMMMLKSDTVQVENIYVMDKWAHVKAFESSLPYALTKAQKTVFHEIKNDLMGPHMMNRLVQGDVGSGKTIIACLALLQACENGYQGVMMAPTEVLARQHYLSLKALFKDYPIHIELLIGSMTAKEKRLAYERIESGEANIIVGTHAVIQENVAFNQLALVITDEQHRFGVKQREKLAGKGHFPHVLVMSATPIPRTLALIVYGDMDISVINELPVGRKPIKTHVVDKTYRERVYHFIEEQCFEGRQCYVICPAVGEPPYQLIVKKGEASPTEDMEDVYSYAEQLKKALPDSITIGILHGKMKAKEKQEVMLGFASGDIQVLVSTTVVEVGVNVPNATLMVIENAERFGLAQLHQLRGRVGRGSYASHCVLISNAKSKVSKERMQVMKNSQDGFVIADYDLKLRGPGDSFGTKQHGLPEFRIGNLVDDVDLLKAASTVAKEIIENNHYLELSEYEYLKRVMNNYFEEHVSAVAL